MKKPGNRYPWLIALFAAPVIIISLSGSALAVDDGARAYWKGKDGTQVVSFQILNLNMQASGVQQFAPGQYIYPNADVDASIFIFNWSRHMTLLNRPSSVTFNLVGGSVDADLNTSLTPPAFLPPGVAPGSTFRFRI